MSDKVGEMLREIMQDYITLASERDELMQARNGLIENNDNLHIQLAEMRAQRDEGLAREAELRSEFASLHKCLERQHREALESLQHREALESLQHRLAEAGRKYDQAIAEMQAVVDTGVLTAADYESLEAEICARITDYWKRPTKLGPGCPDDQKPE